MVEADGADVLLSVEAGGRSFLSVLSASIAVASGVAALVC